MGIARPIARIAVIGPASNAAEVATWRERIAAELPLTSVAQLSLDALCDAAGDPLELDAEIAVLFAPDSQGETDAEVDAVLRSVERGANDPNSQSGARVIVVGDAARLHAPHSGAEFIARASAGLELIPFLRGTLACLQGMRAARRELALLGRASRSCSSRHSSRRISCRCRSSRCTACA